ncbi:MAG TPA: hypothetical protein EYP85_08600 [Armatimonadetes bacterium]|nr:hypothetical protein [Armatimonadota bacterium]
MYQVKREETFPLRELLWGLTLLTLGYLAAPAGAQVVYCNITDVTVKPLINGVQIIVQADGVLDWRFGRGEGPGAIRRPRGEMATRISLWFPEARSQVPNFFDVNIFPVSTIRVFVPQEAQAGIGVAMEIQLVQPSRFEVRSSTDQQSLIITVRTERTVERAGAGRRRAEEAEAQQVLEVSYEEGRLSIHALKVNIHNLLGEIARVTGLNIAVDDAVQHEVSLTLRDLPPEKVMQAIASGYGLALAEMNGVYMFTEGVPTDLAPYNLSGTESFRLKYARARYAAGLLPTFLFKYLLQNPEQNAIVVTAPTQMLDKIRRDLEKIDLAPPQIMVEALAVEITTTAEEELGLSLLRRRAREEYGFDAPLGEVFYRRLDDLKPEFLATLKALLQKGKAKIRANPRMAVINGQTADIFIGTQRFIRVEYLQWGQLQERIQPVDVGVSLEITPWTGGNGEITTRITPQVSNIVELDPQTGLPVLSTREATTSVRVRDGETIVIGGLTLQQEFETKRRIPLLGDIPVLGSLFRSRQTVTTNTELIIFITPYVLTERGRLPDEAAEADIRTRLLGE